MYKLIKNLAPIVLVIFFFSVVVGIGWGEEINNLSAVEKYNQEKKDPWTAVKYSFYLPTLGHYYAGDWWRGTKFLLFETIGLSLVLSGFNIAISEAKGDQYLPILDNATFNTGIIILIVSSVWESIDAYWTAEEFNKNLKERHNITLNIKNNMPCLSINYKF